MIILYDILLVVIDWVGSDIMAICTMNGYILDDFHDSVVWTLFGVSGQSKKGQSKSHGISSTKSHGRTDLKSERWTYPLPLGSNPSQ